MAIQTECKKLIEKDEIFSKNFNSCTKEDQEWVLDYLSTCKVTIPYEMITRYDFLDISPDNGNFFLPHNFYSSLKDGIMTLEEYENVKKNYLTMKLKNLGQLNKIYNFQDSIIICEIFEQRSEHLQKLLKYNPRQCNSTSSFGGCVHRDKSKCLIALPTDAEHVRVFEKTSIEGFSCVNTRLAFDTQIFLDDKRNQKVLFNLKIDGKKQTKRIATKILIMDKNNQYGQAMTKPLPYGCIKKKKHPSSLLEFNKIYYTKFHMRTRLGIFLSLTSNFIIKIQKLCYSMKSIYQSWKRIRKWNRLKGLHFSL